MRNYFLHPEAYPLLLLPWIAEKGVDSEPNISTQTELVYSSINGYLGIRLIDNVMDDAGTTDATLLPLVHFFFSQFQLIYQSFFSHGDPFWNEFSKHWNRMADATMQDGFFKEITRKEFEDVSALKTCAAKIPIVAVLLRRDCPIEGARYDRWMEFVESFGRWHQMKNDIFSYLRDARDGTRTFFLSEARRRKSSAETEIEWAAREGYIWGQDLLNDYADQMEKIACALNNNVLQKYIYERRRSTDHQFREMMPGLKETSHFMRLLHTRVDDELRKE